MSIILVFQILWYTLITLTCFAIFSIANEIRLLRIELRQSKAENLESTAQSSVPQVNNKQGTKGGRTQNGKD